METPFSEQLRRAILDSELSRYAMSKQTGIDQAVLARFVKGTRGLSVESIDKLMHLLGLAIEPRRTGRD